MASFQMAIAQGAEMVELDVRLTRDGVPVVIHDYSLGRTTSGRGLVGLSTWKKLQTLDAGAWFDGRFRGERLLELSDCLRTLTPRLAVNVELKCFFGRPDRLVGACAEAIRASQCQRRVLVTSFNHRAVELFHQQIPEVALGRLFHPLLNGRPRPRDFDWLQQGQRCANELAWDGRALAVDLSLADRKLTDQAHQRGGAVLVYTVNEEKDMHRLIECEVDGVITNFPARYASLLARL